MAAQPSLDGRECALREQVDHPASRRLTDERSIAFAPVPSPVVDDDHPRHVDRGLLRDSVWAAEERILADRKQRPPRQRLRRPASRGPSRDGGTAPAPKGVRRGCACPRCASGTGNSGPPARSAPRDHEQADLPSADETGCAVAVKAARSPDTSPLRTRRGPAQQRRSRTT